MICPRKSLKSLLRATECLAGKRTTHTVINSINSGVIKSFDHVPTKRGLLPASIELLLAGGPGYLHTFCEQRHKELGPIYRDHLGPIEMVFLSDTDMIRTVIANEGQYPRHNIPEAWKYYNEIHGIERGLFFQQGESWARLRKSFNKVMLADPKRFAKELSEINRDLLDHWITKFNRDDSAEFVVPDVKAELCNWSIESTGYMLFGSRMGCIPAINRATSESYSANHLQVDSRADELVESVQRMFAETSNFQLIPVRLAHKLNLATWKRFEAATTNMLRLAEYFATENLSKIGPNSVSILAEMMQMNTISQAEISRSLVDLIIASADTTSNSLQWQLYLLAKHPDIQSRLYREVSEALREGFTNFDESAIDGFRDRVPLLKAFIRESARLYPTAPFLARTLDRDITLGGFNIPAGIPIVFSLYTTSRMDKYFDDPVEFKPERWLRNTISGQPQASEKALACPADRLRHAYASLPFGAGARMCIGRRSAELEMLLFMASFVLKFQSSLLEHDDTRVKLRMILGPADPIKIKLKSREATSK